MGRINVCLSCDNKYARYAAVVIASILANANKEDYLYFYILDGGIIDENKIKFNELKSIKNCEIEFVKINEKDFSVYKKIKTHSYLSVAAYYRLKLASLLPNIDKIIYFDCDIVVNSSLKDLYETDLHENIIAGVLDVRVKHKKKWKNTNYINSGVVLFDLVKFREQDIEHKILQYIIENADKIDTGDQDIINFVLKNRIKIVDDLWNVQVSGFASRTSYTNKPKIIHYIGSDKPWVYASNTYFKDLYFKYLQHTPWKLSEQDKEKWIKQNKIDSRKRFWKRRAYCILHPKYWFVYVLSKLKFI